MSIYVGYYTCKMGLIFNVINNQLGTHSKNNDPQLRINVIIRNQPVRNYVISYSLKGLEVFLQVYL